MPYDPIAGAFSRSFHSSLQQKAMQKRFEAQQERLRKEAAERERRERAKQVAARAKERQKRLDEAAKENRKATANIADQKHRFTIANKRLKPYLDSGKLSPEDLEFVMERISAAPNTSGAMKLIADVEKGFRTVDKPSKPSPDEKFNVVVEKYFSGRELSPAEMRMLDRAIPEGLGTPPETAPEGVTSISGLRKSMARGKAGKQAEQKMMQAKRVYKAEVAEEERLMAGDPDAVRLTGTFDEWMRESDQIKKYGSAYAVYRKKQLEEQISKAALRGSPRNSGSTTGSSTGRSPAKEAGFDANVRSVVPPGMAGAEPQGSGMPQGMSRAAPAARPGIRATPSAPFEAQGLRQMSPGASFEAQDLRQMSPEEAQIDQIIQQLMAKAAENQKFIDSLKVGYGSR